MVTGMKYTSVVKIPNTNGAQLYKRLVAEENRLARLSGYNVKIVESSGLQLARLFPRTYKPTRCHWEDCTVCIECGDNPSKCRARNLVYEGICIDCEEEVKAGERE